MSEAIIYKKYAAYCSDPECGVYHPETITINRLGGGLGFVTSSSDRAIMEAIQFLQEGGLISDEEAASFKDYAEKHPLPDKEPDPWEGKYLDKIRDLPFCMAVNAALTAVIEKVGGAHRLVEGGDDGNIAREQMVAELERMETELEVEFSGPSFTSGGMIDGDWLHLAFWRQGTESTHLFSRMLRKKSTVDRVLRGLKVNTWPEQHVPRNLTCHGLDN